MYQIINKFYKKSALELVQDILQYYELHHFGIINYIYGAILVNNDLLGKGAIKQGINMKDLLLDSDFLLPDGAAIRTLYSTGVLFKKRKGPHIHNLNGTDFMPFFLDCLSQSNYKVNIVTLTVYDEKHNNPAGFLKDGIRDYIQDRRPQFRQHNEEIEYNDSRYKEFDWEDTTKFLTKHQALSDSKNEPTINIFLNFRGGGGRGLPHQELFSFVNKNKMEELNLLCMNQGATVDFWLGKEKRAPQRIRKIRLESVYRLYSDPKKNLKKFFVSFRVIDLMFRRIIFQKKTE